LFDVEFNEPIDDYVLSFSPPAGVDVVGEPILSSTTDP
jgi:outer membrane lipoprotein-sorting protein